MVGVHSILVLRTIFREKSPIDMIMMATPALSISNLSHLEIPLLMLQVVRSWKGHRKVPLTRSERQPRFLLELNYCLSLSIKKKVSHDGWVFYFEVAGVLPFGQHYPIRGISHPQSPAALIVSLVVLRRRQRPRCHQKRSRMIISTVTPTFPSQGTPQKFPVLSYRCTFLSKHRLAYRAGLHFVGSPSYISDRFYRTHATT
jgi:hypothetical protein